MNSIAAFFTANMIYVFFFYGLAFFAMGLAVFMESGRAAGFRLSRALVPLALFGLIHGGHEWYEMFQLIAAGQGQFQPGLSEDWLRAGLLAISFLLLLDFGLRLLPGAEAHPRAHWWQLAVFAGVWLVGIVVVALLYRPTPLQLAAAADVLARYVLGIPGALLAGWVLLRERREFRARGMETYGRGLLWAALAFFVYGAVGQLFVRSSLVFPSGIINTGLFLQTVGIPVQVLRGTAAIVIAVGLTGGLRAFEAANRQQLLQANAERLAALEAQQRRADEVEALNVRLQATARELSALVEMSRILASTIERDQLLPTTLRQVVYSLDGVCCSRIYLQRAGDALILAGEFRRPEAPEPAVPPPLRAVATMASTTGQPAAADLEGQVRLLRDLSADENGTAKGANRRLRVLGVPLQTKEERFGALVIASFLAETPLTAATVGLTNAFAQQIAAALENARLYEVVQMREGQLKALVHQLVNAQEYERQRIARELHDDTGQKLTALAMGLAAVETQIKVQDLARATDLLHHLRALNDQTVEDLRHIMANLRPAQLDDLGLVPAVRWYIQQYEARYPNLKVTLTATRLARRLPAEVETILFRIVQEALSNVARHAQAAQVTVSLDQVENQVWLKVCDNGVGFDPAQRPTDETGRGLGLVGMRERAALIGGTCQIESKPGHGTCVTASLPLAA